jgi:hypothetical protein
MTASSDAILNVIELLLLIVIAGFGKYYISYFKKKGDNLAKKEDIAELTEIVQQIEHNYATDIESLKAKLTILTNKRTSVFEEEKESIVTFFASVNYWVWDTLHIETHEYFHGNYGELSDKIIRFRDAYKKVNVAMSKVDLLISNPELVKSGNDLVTASLKLSHFVDLKVSALKRNLTSERILVDAMFKDMDKRKMPVAKDDPINQFMLSEAKDLRSERETLLKSYHGEFLALFKIVAEKRREFIIHAHAYLNKEESQS